MSVKNIVINGTDVTQIIAPYTYEVFEIFVTGSNAGVMLDGSEEPDIIRVKDGIIIPLLPLKEEDMLAVMQSLRGRALTEIYYFSQNYGGYRTAEFIRSEARSRHRLTNVFGDEIYIANSLEFRERG